MESRWKIWWCGGRAGIVERGDGEQDEDMVVWW